MLNTSKVKSLNFIFSSVQWLSHVWLFATPWTAARQASLFVTNPWSLLNLMSIVEKAIAPHSSALAWKIPWMEEPGRLQSMGLLRVRHDWATERLHFHFSLSCVGEDGNPLQCSCLENPRDRGAWWAAVYGVAQSRTRLKPLSSNSSSNVLVRMWRDWTPCTLLVECKLTQPPVGKSLVFLQEVKHRTTIWPHNSTPRSITRKTQNKWFVTAKK